MLSLFIVKVWLGIVEYYVEEEVFDFENTRRFATENSWSLIVVGGIGMFGPVGIFRLRHVVSSEQIRTLPSGKD